MTNETKLKEKEKTKIEKKIGTHANSKKRKCRK
jgi:hypothetical protein